MANRAEMQLCTEQTEVHNYSMQGRLDKNGVPDRQSYSNIHSKQKYSFMQSKNTMVNATDTYVVVYRANRYRGIQSRHRVVCRPEPWCTKQTDKQHTQYSEQRKQPRSTKHTAIQWDAEQTAALWLLIRQVSRKDQTVMHTMLY